MDGKVVITGDPSSLLSAMQKAGDAVRGFQTQAEGSFGRIQSAIGSVQGKWLALGSAILGGAGFKEAIDTSVTLTKEANSLAKALGINATEASVLNLALGDIYQSKDTMIAANTAMTRTLRENEQAFTKLGVTTRDQNGHFRSSLDIMLDVNARLAKFKEGVDRNIEGTKIYGKQWGEVAGLLKLNAELMENSRQKAADLNLAVGEESIESTAKYRAAMNDTEDVLTAMKNTIGQAVMPVMTELGNEFSENGPQSIEYMRKAIAILVVGFYGLKNAGEIVWIAMKAQIESIVVAFLTLADVGQKALNFDFSGARRAFTNGWDQIKEINKKGGADILAANEKNGEAIKRALERGFDPVKSTPVKSKSGGAGSDGRSTGGEKGGKDESRFREWDAELTEFKLKEQEKALAEGRFYQMSVEEERKFWQGKIALTDAGSKEQIAVRKKLADLGLAVLKEQYEAEQEALRTQMEVAKDEYAKRDALAARFAENAKQRYGADSKEYQAALKQQEGIRREHAEKMRQIDSIRLENVRRASEQVVTENERIAQMEYDLGLITRERLLELQRGFITEKMNLEMQAADYELGLYKSGTVEYEQALARKLEVKRKYDGLLSENSVSSKIESMQPQTNIFGTAQNSMQSAMDGMLTKTQTWSQAMQGIYRSTGLAMIQEMVTKPFTKWVAQQVQKLAMNMGFLTTENAQQAAAAVTSSGIAIADATTKIGANAAVAGAGAASSQASIPYVGPILAVAAMAAIFAAVMGMRGKMKSAAGGFDIPKGMNPVTQLHAEEMVIPAKYANGLRDLINGGGGGGGESIVYNDHSGRLSRSEIERNANIIADVLKKRRRDNAF